jgi:hypothetical protein
MFVCDARPHYHKASEPAGPDRLRAIGLSYSGRRAFVQADAMRRIPLQSQNVVDFRRSFMLC